MKKAFQPIMLPTKEKNDYSGSQLAQAKLNLKTPLSAQNCKLYTRDEVINFLKTAFVIGAGNPTMNNFEVDKWIEEKLK